MYKERQDDMKSEWKGYELKNIKKKIGKCNGERGRKIEERKI